MTKPRTDIYSIIWIDSAVQNGQVGVAELPMPTRIESVGHIVAETEAYVTLARDLMDEPGAEWRGLLCIPRESIRSMHPLGRAQHDAYHPKSRSD